MFVPQELNTTLHDTTVNIHCMCPEFCLPGCGVIFQLIYQRNIKQWKMYEAVHKYERETQSSR